MTEKELDLYARWESERIRLVDQAHRAFMSGYKTLGLRYEDRANERYECMRDLSRQPDA